MPMGNIETYYQVVTVDTVRKVVGDELVDQFLEAVRKLEDDGNSVCEISELLNEYETEEIDEYRAAGKAYDALRDAFFDRAEINLYYEYLSGDGDYYDDLDGGWTWHLDEDEVWSRTLTGKAREFTKKYGEDAIEFDQRFSSFG